MNVRSRMFSIHNDRLDAALAAASPSEDDDEDDDEDEDDDDDEDGASSTCAAPPLRTRPLITASANTSSTRCVSA